MCQCEFPADDRGGVLHRDFMRGMAVKATEVKTKAALTGGAGDKRKHPMDKTVGDGVCLVHTQHRPCSGCG